VSAITASDRLSALPRPPGSLVVSEIFGPTFQGEGPSLGRRCSFIRLGGCNLHCSWCDTPYTWDWTGRNGIRYDPKEELLHRSADEVWADLTARGTDMLVVTGGEPMLQQSALTPLLQMSKQAGWWVEMETAGTVVPSTELARLVSRFNVSPKLSNSGNDKAHRYRPAAIDALQATGKAAWKFVVVDELDLEEIGQIVSRHDLDPVYVMPEGLTAAGISSRAQQLAEAVLARGWNLTTRLHVLLYGNQRGV
jgi:7-carboxy-7-deazaguanine synthase